MSSPYALGLDFGTESARALLVRVEDGWEAATAVFAYPDGVIDERLPGGRELPPDWALQNPGDYLAAVEDVVPRVLGQAGARPEEVVGIGIDFTACTPLPTRSDGTPLCFLPALRDEPHAWVKLWKHHAAQPQADRITEVAADRQEPFLPLYGGRLSSEWLFPKALQLFDEAPEVFEVAERFVEAGDWIVWQLTGREKRNSCAAGYKALWQKGSGYPDRGLWEAVRPGFARVMDKLAADVTPVGTLAGGLTVEWASKLGLAAGLPVAVATIDAHAGLPGSGASRPGVMALIMGTSICHMLLAREQRLVEGMAGVVEDGILPGYFGYEAGQASGGDVLAWYVERAVPAGYREEAARLGQSLHALLGGRASRLAPGENGLLTLDWWNGNRSVLQNAELSGLIVGLTIGTRPEDIYRSLIESLAFGTRRIVEAFTSSGVPVERLVASGTPAQSPLIIRVFADVLGRPLQVAASEQATALGAAIFGAVAAGAERGGLPNFEEGIARLARLQPDPYQPDPKHTAVYDRMYREYVRLYDYFGRGENPVMRLLRRLKGH